MTTDDMLGLICGPIKDPVKVFHSIAIYIYAIGLAMPVVVLSLLLTMVYNLEWHKVLIGDLLSVILMFIYILISKE